MVMAREIERKFLVKGEAWKSQAFAKKHYAQGYLNDISQPGSLSSIRIRIEDNKGMLNIKSLEIGLSRDEYEYEIPEWYGEDDIFYYTQKVIHDELPIERKIRRVPQRKVTLIELINAFEEAREQIKKRRRRSREKEWNNVNASDTVHKEDIEEDMKIVMEKLSKLNGRAIPLKELYNTKEEMLSMLLPLLFLAKEGRIVIWQNSFPYGEIYIKLKHGS